MPAFGVPAPSACRLGFRLPEPAAQAKPACGGLTARRTPGRRFGFTLVELLIVITIIVLLVGVLAAWAFGARKNQKVRSTEAAMSNLLLVTDTVKNASPIFPDHRLANYFYVQKHTATTGVMPIWNNAAYRRMSSGEFVAFLATLVPSSDSMIHSLGNDYLKPTAVPASWNSPADNAGVLVDVFEQDPANPQAVDKNAASTSFSLVSSTNGYRLRAPVDAWGNELVYRFSTYKNDLNRADGDAPLYDDTGVANGTYQVREDIVQDEQATRNRYAALGVAVDAAVATPATAEYVRPAVAAYGHPFWMSAGPDGLWGKFQDGAAPSRDATSPNKDSARDSLAKDNIYSHESGR